MTWAQLIKVVVKMTAVALDQAHGFAVALWSWL